ncbi:MAG: chromosome segregation protein SMC [Planctomycetota bacterium]|jgi:chromosome segregation protein
MKISKLILHGFKSFADKTEFDFTGGITVIVGPNGCGKSNVVDAVKWVLGEQRPTSLRGKEMQDVIFSGTDSRKGLGFAEVTVIFDNAERTLPIDYAEVSVTRRLYKSGESEYQINGNSARLRDIRELLMDSGGGPGALTVMEQGNIDRLLRADPHERRLVFEEAAGIAKYRARRKETERKLERTNENLARMRDMLGEYETRQRSLKIQAGKARRFHEMTEELKRKRLTGALARYGELARRRDAALELLESTQRDEQDARARLARAVEGGADRRKELDEMRERASASEAEMAGLVGEKRAEAEKRSARDREATELSERAGTAEVEGAAAAERAQSFDTELAAARAETERAGSDKAERDATLEAADALFQEVDGRIQLLRTQRNELDLRRTEAFGLETDARNREAGAEAEFRTLRNRLERLRQRAQETGAELVTLKAAREESDIEVKREEENLRALEDRFTAAEAGVREARDAIETCGAEHGRLAGELKAATTRRDILAGLVQEGEGVDSGVRELLKAAETGRVEGVRGTLADLIGNVGDEAAALDQALGGLAGALVVETTEQALGAIDWLKQGRRGRARLIPLDRVARGDPPQRFAGLLDGDTAGLVGGLLRDTRIVESVEEALREDSGTRVIALSGEEFERGGSIYGGMGDAGGGLVLRNAELAEVEKRLETSEDEREQAKNKLAVAKQDAVEWEETLAELRPRLKLARDTVRAAGQRQAAADKAAMARADEIDLESAERSEVEAMLVDCQSRSAKANEDREVATRDREQLERESGELKERLVRASADREAASARQTEARVEAARWAEKVEAAETRRKDLEAAIETARREAQMRAEEARTCLARRQACLDEIEVIDRLARDREVALERLSKQVEQHRAEARALAEELETGDAEVRELRDVHERRRSALEEHRLKENELKLRLETLLEQVRRDHGLDLAAELAQRSEDEDADPDALEAEILELQSKLERLGNVNHAALDQLAEVDEKLSFLRREETDLVSAEKQLRETIVKIDEVCTTRFSETFHTVAEKFKVTFRKLFGGGRAEISLEDPEDVLNSGIEIRVRPPGKELRNMALLSGGEKSLTTVALLFAIYQTKPPPFCLLDEVDAALDEPNTVRMCEMLKEFADHGQFLVITHARPTMTVADTLYGVTMPEAGVSRRVSVRFQDIEAGRVVGLN